MKCTIFYAWQSQLPNSTNRGFIGDALEKALKGLRDDVAVEELPEITQGPGNEPGSPNIGDAILAQLDVATAVVFDVSLVPSGDVPDGHTRDVRPAPNANVLVELGYTLKSAGHERIILVMNTAYGKPEQLPFDFRQRYVVTYKLAEGEDKTEVRKGLVSALSARLKNVLALPPRAGRGPVTVRNGEPYTLLASDRYINFDTTDGAATANMIAPSRIGQTWTFYWAEWGAGHVMPTINAPPGIKMIPYSGKAKPGVAGLVASTTISTPGASYTLIWNGTELGPA